MSRIFPATDLSGWRKSSYSGGVDNGCVEVVDHLVGVVPVRDSKVPGGPAVLMRADAWAALVNHVKGSGPTAS
ncbi:DUF397 domain-containing protein [Streptomyces sp. NBRC 109706]|uniref:DUF397 domain-containing protein n=1 Tax=Streptomyces sp. NBRC 109706 TaxID=1550035 RepID=UPI00099C78FC|nr:DUF397 domain-containing protein [Streptomyces sp. NBRC 109706]